jgi:hypothetical protein
MLICSGTNADNNPALAESWMNSARHWGSYYNVIWNNQVVNQSAMGGAPRLVFPSQQDNGVYPIQWAVDDSYHAADALVTFSLIHNDSSVNVRIRGQLWDAVLINKRDWSIGDEITFDGHTWAAMTFSCAVYGLTLFILKA